MSNFSAARKQLQLGKLSVPELVDEYLNRIREKNPTLNAFISVDEESAREQASSIQSKIDSGEAGRLAGSVFGIKDAITEKGKKTTCASHMLRNFESVYDATVIERLRSEDAVLIGRLNMDEFAMGSSNENTIYGPVRNPHDTEKVAGGSSGGSAAAVASGMCSISLGSDSGGSIRQPASYCGVVGLKPTYGRVSRYGLVAYASSFDSIGPLATSVEDAARTLGVIAGHDPADNTSSSRAVPDYVSDLEQDEVLTVGIPEEYFGEGLDEQVERIVRSRLDELEKDRRIRTVPVHLPHMKYGIATYYILATAEASSNLARFDGVRYGHRADIGEVKRELREEQDLLEHELAKAADPADKESLNEKLAGLDSALIRLYKKSRTEGFGMEVKRRIMLGTYVLSAGYYDAYYLKAQKVRRLIKEDFDNVFNDVDVVVSPTVPTPAFNIGAEIEDPVQMYLNDIYTSSANLAGICGISVPAGTNSEGLPVGVQFMGDTFQEGKILRAARLIEQQNG